MPSGSAQQHQLVGGHELHSHHHHHQQQAPFMEDPIPSLFSISQQHHHQHHQFHVYEEAPFCSLNFKLGLNENSSSSSVGGFGNLVVRHHDVPEARPNSLGVPNSWQDSDPIKETFWKPLDNGGKCYKEEERHHNNITLEEKYRLFSELEAIYSLPNVPTAPDQAGSALTGETSAAVDVDVPAAANAPTRGSEVSIGGEEAASQRKRKRKKKMKEQLGFVVGFFECLVKRVMEHQEGLHRKFMEAIERMDKGRTESEEAWRRQEAEKRNREAMNRAHDQALASSREALVVKYIEKITGESVDLPDRTQLVASDTNSRWPKAEVEALIGARSRLEPKFQEPGLKGPLWEEVSSAMASMGYQRSAKRCKEKWENINKYFRKKKENANSKGKKKKSKSCEPSKTCSYFDQLDQLYSRTDQGLGNDDNDRCSAQPRGGYSELLAYIVAQNPNMNACGIESSKSANLDEKVEGNENISSEEGGGGEEDNGNDLGD